MKVRTGFVSNSSSTSFAIIGVGDHKNIRKIMRALGIDEDWIESELGYGNAVKDEVMLCGSSYDDIYYAGLQADHVLQTRTIPDACKFVQAHFLQKYNLAIPLEDIKFLYGETGDG